MLNTTLALLRCPRKKRGKASCEGSLALTSIATRPATAGGVPSEVFEVTTGHLDCEKCSAQYPILSGVAIVVEDVQGYLQAHVKGISQRVPDDQIPPGLLSDYLEAKAELQEEHIEEDLEAERVIALYVMNHYLRAAPDQVAGEWWRPLAAADGGSEAIDFLMRKYWDHGPFEQIATWLTEPSMQSGPSPISISPLPQGSHPSLKGEVSLCSMKSVVELGCGVGGLFALLRARQCIGSYLGVDSSFASIAVGRHLALGVPLRGKLLFPEDLLQGSVSRKIPIPKPVPFDGSGDLIVGDLERLPLATGQWDLSVALNTIDMLDEPALLPQTQFGLLRKGGMVIQSCPYVWADSVAKRLRSRLPKQVQDSAAAVEWIYQQAGFKVERTLPHLPWLFFKHLRQLELYSVHLFSARKEH